MKTTQVNPESIGREVVGPIVGEFCLRLSNLGSLFSDPDDAMLLFCARGGLRMQLAYERFLTSTGTRSPLQVSSLMVSRAAAIRPSLARSITMGATTLAPAVAAAVTYEFAQVQLRAAVKALSGAEVAIADDAFWNALTTPTRLLEALARPEAAEAAASIVTQGDLFGRHLREVLGGRHNAVLVDTGLFGTTGQLLAEGFPDINISTALMGRTFRPLLGAPKVPTFGLSVHARSYDPRHRRTALFRYWHFVEWLFEPDLSSVRRFEVVDGRVMSNLEVPGWRERIEPTPGTAFAGVIDYIDSLRSPHASTVIADAARGWRQYRRAIVWPNAAAGRAITVDQRSHDFGRDETWGARPWRGAFAALRGQSMWREGEIARSGTVLRLPLLAAIETAYTLRGAVRWVKRRFR